MTSTQKPTASANVAAKASRLVQNFRVIKLTQATAMVIGDTSTYSLWQASNGAWRCNCRWGSIKSSPCSHAIAVASATPESQAPVQALAKLINHGLLKLQQDATAALGSALRTA